MPYCERPGLKIHYVVHESVRGPTAPVLLVLPGMLANVQTFPYLVERLVESHRVILVDPRGAGETEPRHGRWELAEVADDAAAVLAELEVSEADVLGISMGGMVAQELALSYPLLVRRLVLCCTWARGRGGARAPAGRVLRFGLGLARHRLAPDAAAFARRHGDLLLSPETVGERRESFFAHRFATTRSSARGLLSQIRAVRRFDARSRLADLKAPALVLAGRSDGLIAPAETGALAERIPGAVYRELAGGHAFFYESLDEFLAIVGAFLAGGDLPNAST